MHRKARLFLGALGITADNAEELRDALLKAVKTQDAQIGQRDIYGQRYIVDFMFAWRNRQTIIRSAWIIAPDSDVPRLITAYPL